MSARVEEDELLDEQRSEDSEGEDESETNSFIASDEEDDEEGESDDMDVSDSDDDDDDSEEDEGETRYLGVDAAGFACLQEPRLTGGTSGQRRFASVISRYEDIIEKAYKPKPRRK